MKMSFKELKVTILQNINTFKYKRKYHIGLFTAYRAALFSSGFLLQRIVQKREPREAKDCK